MSRSKLSSFKSLWGNKEFKICLFFFSPSNAVVWLVLNQITCIQSYGHVRTVIPAQHRQHKTWEEQQKTEESHRMLTKSDDAVVKPANTHTALGSEKTSAWMCIIRSPPAAYSMTKHTCSCVWKHANKLTRKGWRTLLTVSKILFSHIRLERKRKVGDVTHTSAFEVFITVN